MGNSTNLSAEDISNARNSVLTASSAILTNSALLSTATKDFVTIMETIEKRAQQIEEKEAILRNFEEDIAKKHQELDEKNRLVSEREAVLQAREIKLAEQEKLWGELKKVIESTPSTAPVPAPLSPPPTPVFAVPTPVVPVQIHSPQGESTLGVPKSTSASSRLRSSSFVSLHEAPNRYKRPEAMVTPDYPFRRSEVGTPDPLHQLRGGRDSKTPDSAAIPASLLVPATESFNVWLPTRTFSLLYKATRDGFSRADFHKICDNKGPTVALILSDKGYLFGGYAPISWGRTFEGYDTHPECFLFTLSNPHDIPPTQYKLRTGNAYGLRNGQHVSFGWCGDIRIADENAHLTAESTTNFARSFVDTTGKGNATFTGEHKFKVLEIEIYLVM